MKSAALLRSHIEQVLANRVPAPLTTRERATPQRIASGIPAYDELLHGGLPQAVLTEFVGAECSGRTSLALAYTAAITRSGSVCAWIDVADSLDPESVAANGVDLDRLLWVRCGRSSQPFPPAACPAAAPAPASPGIVPAPSSQPVRGGGGSPHPRSEARDMPAAIQSMLQTHGGLYDHHVRREKRSIGTPGAPNRPLTQASSNREEQIPTDRQPSRRDQLPLPIAARKPLTILTPSTPPPSRLPGKPWQALDQALRATDLLLQGGGFTAIILDLAATPPDAAWRIPLATWFRYRAACERTRVSLLVLTQHPCTRSSAELVVRLDPVRLDPGRPDPGRIEAAGPVMTAIRYRAEIERERSIPPTNLIPIRKPPQSERGQWKARASWALSR